MNVNDLRATLDYRIKRYQSFMDTKLNLEDSNNTLMEEVNSNDEDLRVIQESAIYYKKSQDILYQRSIGALKDLINSALAFIFRDREYEISINIEDKRGAKNLTFGLKDLDCDFEVSLKNGCGNGVRSVISAILNIFVLLNKNRKVLILDEKYSYISTDYLENFFIFLSKICREKGLRVILISHDPRFIEFAEKVYLVSEGYVSLVDDSKRELEVDKPSQIDRDKN